MVWIGDDSHFLVILFALLALHLPEYFDTKCNSRQKQREVKLVMDLWARSPTPSPERKPKKKPKQEKAKAKPTEKKKPAAQGEQIRFLLSRDIQP